MKKNILAICDDEISYCNRVATYLSTHGFHQYTIMTFSSMERLDEYFNQDSDRIEILLISETVYREGESLKKASKIILLQDKGLLSVKGVSAIKKYQSVSNLMKEVSELYAQDVNCKGMLSTMTNKTKIYGVYTPGEDDISHICACLFAQMMAERKRVLYLNLATYASMKGLIPEKTDSEDYDLGDLLYYLKQNEEKALYKIEAIKHSIGKLDYISPIAYPGDLKEITMEDWMKLINCLCLRSEYEIVVLDCGEALTDLYGILEVCDSIITPVTKNPFLQERMRILTKMCMEKGLEHILEKMIQLEIFEDKINNLEPLSEIKQGYLGSLMKEMVKKYDIECI